MPYPLEQVAAIRRNLPTMLRDSINAERAAGTTWPQIAATLGVSINGARLLAGHAKQYRETS